MRILIMLIIIQHSIKSIYFQSLFKDIVLTRWVKQSEEIKVMLTNKKIIIPTVWFPYLTSSHILRNQDADKAEYYIQYYDTAINKNAIFIKTLRFEGRYYNCIKIKGE